MSTWDEAYEGTPPWDIGRPQEVMVAVLASEDVGHRVLEVGCGTGENALHAATVGHDVVGIDGSARAIALAREKAAARNVSARFAVHDVLDLEGLDEEPFGAVLDVGCFHTFGDADRSRYVASVAGVLRPGGRLFVLCFSDAEPDWGGPRRIRREELLDTFEGRFRMDSVEPTWFESNLRAGQDEPGAHAWLASMTLREG